MSQLLHWYGFSPVCIFRCLKITLIWERFFRKVPLKNVPSLCVQIFLRILFLKKAFSHSIHWNGFSPVCMFICLWSLNITILWEKLAIKIIVIFVTRVYTLMCLKITSVRKTCYNGYIDMVFPQYVASDVLQICCFWWKA